MDPSVLCFLAAITLNIFFILFFIVLSLCLYKRKKRIQKEKEEIKKSMQFSRNSLCNYTKTPNFYKILEATIKVIKEKDELHLEDESF